MSRGGKWKFYNKVKYEMALDWYDILIYKYDLFSYKHRQQHLSHIFQKKSIENDMSGYKQLMRLLTKTEKMQNIIDLMIKCYQLRGVDHFEYEKQYILLLQLADELDADILSSYRWKNMQGAAFNLGLFSLGLCFRNKAIEKVKMHQEEKKYKYQRFLVALEEQDYSYANELIADMEKDQDTKYMSIQFEIARQYLCIMCNDEQYFEMNYRQLSIEDKDFYDQIKEKDFILFGAVYEDLSGYNVKDDTKMIRINYAGESTLGKAIKYKNVWMSYYRAINRIWQFDESNAKKEFSSIEYLINYSENVSKKYLDKKVRTASNITSLCFEGFNYMVPFILFDLAKMGRRKIKVTGVNLFHGEIHDESYFKALTDKEENKRSYWNSFFRHSVITQFIMIKNMRAAGVIEPIGVLNDVLDLSLEQYIEDLEKIYVM